MLMTLLRPGEVVLLDRNCHKSVHQAVVMSGALPLYLTPVYNKKLGVWAPLSRAEIMRYVTAKYDENVRPRMLILTSCTYEGVLYPIHEIAAVCEAHGILLYADEAWAPYLRFHPFYTQEVNGRKERYNATDAGAHFAVQSTHKGLAAFSQASMIHVGKGFRRLLEETNTEEFSWLCERFSFDGAPSYERFRHELQEILRYWHSTSPHYPMLASLDRSGIQMRIEGMHLLAERLRWVENITKRIEDAVGRPCVARMEHIVGSDRSNNFSGYLKDPLKLILVFADESSGSDFKKALEQAHIQWEKSSSGCIEFLVTVGTFNGHLQALLRVIVDNKNLLGLRDTSSIDESDFDSQIAAGQVTVLPRDAVSGPSELVPLEDSIGRVCAQMLVPYPPGIPVFLPGLEITAKMVELVNAAIESGSAHDVHGIFERGDGHFVRVLPPEVADSPLVEALRTTVDRIRTAG
jgi:arginine decarboxylase